ncbi:hypothetical protein OCUAc20_47100 (plasmid) [Acinetobacter baumannii]|nr:hypothetical protein OCUAc20_47100 [Acinetobacter baumannii]
MKKLSDEYLPVRKAQTVYGSISGNYAFRGEKTIWFESTLERDFILKQEFNNNVIDVIGQPVVIPYITELGNQSNYTLTFWCSFQARIVMILRISLYLCLLKLSPRKSLLRTGIS